MEFEVLHDKSFRKAVNSVDDISVGGTVEILMSDGTARAMITKTEKSNEVHIK